MSKKKARSKKAASKKTARKTTSKKVVKKKSAKKKAAKKKATATKKKKATKRPTRGKSREPKVLKSPNFQGKSKKLVKETYPEKAAAKDFQCFGPAATKDGEFDSVRICDMGCFWQDGKDCNKYYHGAIVQHRKSKNWYTYFEWGRTGGASYSFQFVASESEEEARKVFAKQLHAKNDRRGEWVTIAGLRTLRAKPGKDCYLVRPMATRTTGLPDARNIEIKHAGSNAAKTKSSAATKSVESDSQTTKLLLDLRKATIAYTRQSMADSSIPTQKAVNEARQILGEASERVGEIDSDIEAQTSDKRLMQLTALMFSRIPRKKKVGADAATWVLSQDNIQDWHIDLDAFESALYAIHSEVHPEIDILGDMNLDMQWICPDTKIGQTIHDWMPTASKYRHKKMKQMRVVNLWEVSRQASEARISKAQKRVLKSKVDLSEKPANQLRSRIDVSRNHRADFKGSNTALLFHGTRSVNVSAILRESLRMPQTLVAVALTGAKFGPGIYFSDDWQKSANYSNAKGSTEAGTKGKVRGRKAFLFLADVVLGTSHVAPKIMGFTKPPRGHHSVFGKAGVSGVDDNEFVVYKPDQFRLRYLVEFESS